jgi:alkylated DNA repair dioxygenase AlkB
MAYQKDCFHQQKQKYNSVHRDESVLCTVNVKKDHKDPQRRDSSIIQRHEDVVLSEPFDYTSSNRPNRVVGDADAQDEDSDEDFKLIAPNVYRRCLPPRKKHNTGPSSWTSTSRTDLVDEESCIRDQPIKDHESRSSRNDCRQRRLLFTRKVWDGRDGKWKSMEYFFYINQQYQHPIEAGLSIHSIPPRSDEQQSSDVVVQYKIILSRGGEIHVFPNLIPYVRTKAIKDEILNPKHVHCFRKYCIQGDFEPRVHFLLHRDATSDFSSQAQPGYEYSQIKMKARALSLFPQLETLSHDIGQLRNVQHWDIGIDTILYRDWKDSMGDHADNDQGETKVFALIVETPPTPRVVRVNVFRKLTECTIGTVTGDCNHTRRRMHIRQDGDEIIELHLHRGDAYEMDGTMQLSYSHGVPRPRVSPRETSSLTSRSSFCSTTQNANVKSDHDPVRGDDDVNDSILTNATICKSRSNIKNNQFQRVCVVLRTGIQRYIVQDSGRACTDLHPKKPLLYTIGKNPQVQEGTEWTRRELRDMGAFQVRETMRRVWYKELRC